MTRPSWNWPQGAIIEIALRMVQDELKRHPTTITNEQALTAGAAIWRNLAAAAVTYEGKTLPRPNRHVHEYLLYLVGYIVADHNRQHSDPEARTVYLPGPRMSITPTPKKVTHGS